MTTPMTLNRETLQTTITQLRDLIARLQAENAGVGDLSVADSIAVYEKTIAYTEGLLATDNMIVGYRTTIKQRCTFVHPVSQRACRRTALADKLHCWQHDDEHRQESARWRKRIEEEVAARRAAMTQAERILEIEETTRWYLEHRHWCRTHNAVAHMQTPEAYMADILGLSGDELSARLLEAEPLGMEHLLVRVDPNAPMIDDVVALMLQYRAAFARLTPTQQAQCIAQLA